MTIDDAVRVLNERAYTIENMPDLRWAQSGSGVLLVDRHTTYRNISAFEAIAIAEGLERDAKPNPAADWFARLVEANEIGDANAASYALAELRALGWEIKATDGTWGDRRSMPATRRLIGHLKSVFDAVKIRGVSSDPSSKWFLNMDGKTLTLSEIDSASAEWEDKP